MSHYTVMVIGPETDDDLAEALAPYDENKEMEPYRDYLDPDPSKFWTNNDGHLADWPAIIAEYAAKYPDSSDIPLLDEAGLPYEVSTYNPDSKWDWYAIGGRWAGTLRLKAGVLAVPPNTSGWVWKNAGPDELPPPGRADRARLGDIDLDGWRSEALLDAEERWGRWEVLVATHGEPPVWNPPEANCGLDAYRAQHRAHPAVVAVKEVFSDQGFFFDAAAEFGGLTREDYLAASMAAAVPCFATLLCLDGSHWIEPGRMGFGESSDTRDSRAAYNAKVNELLDGLGADTWITVVDCHI